MAARLKRSEAGRRETRTGALLRSESGSLLQAPPAHTRISSGCCGSTRWSGPQHRAGTGLTAAAACVLFATQPSTGQQAGPPASPHTCIPARGGLFSSLLGDANRQISEYKFKLSKAEQDITTLEQSVSPSCERYQVISVPLTTHLLPASQWLTP